ncbi:MAG: OB-fold nucleic acid binding domain-containing protein, partial [Planctomycetota bacterium]
KRTAASISRDDVGSVVVLTGTLSSITEIPKGTKAYLEDGTKGKVVIVVWDTVRKKFRDPGLLSNGKRVQVVGKVLLFKGELQVVPEEGWDVVEKK